MKKINFEAGTQVSPAKVTIDNVDHEVTPAVWEGNTPLSPFVLNKMQDNIEEETKTIQTTEVSEELTIENCAGVKGKLDIKSGKSIQEGEPSSDNIIPIRNVGDNINLIDSSGIQQGYAYDDNGNYIASKYYLTIRYMSVKPNTMYTYQDNLSDTKYTSIRVVEFNQSKTFILRSAPVLRSNMKFTTSSNCYYVAICIYTSDTALLSDLEYAKLEEGSTPTPYTPYNCGSVDFKLSNEDNSQSRIVSFPFTEGQVLHKGDYLAKDGIYNERNTLILNGDETITNVSNSLTNTVRIYWKNIMTKSSTSIGSRLGFKSNMLIGKLNWDTDEVGGYIDSDGTSFIARLPKSLVGETEDTVKAWLSQNPLTIEYRLATETITPYTTEQEEAYYELQHLLMYEGYTSIECLDEIKPDIQVTYLYNNELNKSYGKRFDEVDNNIKELEDANIYSTEEQVIGKWIDGKTLYRKVFTSSTFSTSYSIPIINADKVIDIKGIINRKDYTNMIVPIPSRVTDSSMKVDYQYLDRVSTRILVSLAYGTSWSESLFNEVTFIIEYTKTTD